MNLTRVLLIILAVIVVGALLVGGCVYRGYSTTIDLDETTKRTWKDVDVQLQRRFDLIPNVVEAVKGVAGQEKEIFLGVAKAREAYLDRLWSFVSRLTPAFNSLKAHVLHHRLVHDRSAGKFDADRFMTYIKLPRSASYAKAIPGKC